MWRKPKTLIIGLIIAALCICNVGCEGPDAKMLAVRQSLTDQTLQMVVVMENYVALADSQVADKYDAREAEVQANWARWLESHDNGRGGLVVGLVDEDTGKPLLDENGKQYMDPMPIVQVLRNQEIYRTEVHAVAGARSEWKSKSDEMTLLLSEFADLQNRYLRREIDHFEYQTDVAAWSQRALTLTVGIAGALAGAH